MRDLTYTKTEAACNMIYYVMKINLIMYQCIKDFDYEHIHDNATDDSWIMARVDFLMVSHI